jgi:hypothetical protein
VRTKVIVTLALLLCMAVAASAQFGRGGGFFRFPPRFPTAETFGHGFNFCRALYTSIRREAGGQGWSTDYPDAELNFSLRLGELTRTRVSKDATGSPDHLVVRLTDDELFQCPYLHIEDVGSAALTEREVEALRTYLLKGGFLWVDDFWGEYAWTIWQNELERILSPTDYPIRDLTLDHPVFSAMFDVHALPQIPSIQYWRQSGGDTSERGRDSAVPHFRGVSDASGNLMVLMTHNTDISDSWEREGEDPRFFYNFSPDGYAVGINVVMYAMTH